MKDNANAVRIKEIHLKNFRLFGGDQSIIIPQGKKGNIVVVEGENGFGKSNIFNAITWCLFGQELHLRPDDRTLPICNTSALKDIAVGKSLETKVTLTLDTPSGEKRIERSVLFTKTTADKAPFQADGKFTVFELVNKNWNIAPNPDYIVSRIVPNNMQQFFFIDGEQLRSLFQQSEPEVIKQSIFELSQLSLLQNAAEHLESLKGELKKEAGLKNDPNLGGLEEAVEFLEKELETAKKDMEQAKATKGEAVVNKRRLEGELADLDIADVKNLEERRKETEERIKKLGITRQDSRQTYFELVCDAGPKVIFRGAMEKTAKSIEQLEGKAELPPKISAVFLRELLEKGSCICGVDLAKPANKTHKDRLEEILGRTRDKEFAEVALNLKFCLAQTLRGSESKLKNIAAVEKSLAEGEKEIGDAEKVLKEIGEKLGGINVENVQRIKEEIDRYTSMINQADGQIGRLQVSISKSQTNLNEANKQLSRAMQRQSKFKQVQSHLETCDQAIEELRNIKEKLMKEIKGEAESNTQKYFKALVSAKDFSPPTISDNYELIIEKDGFNAITSLSAAETLCMGFSFMAALRKTSGFFAPIVIDTPLAKVSAYRKNIAEWLKDALPDAQIILLVTPKEYTSDFEAVIRPSVACKFELRHDKRKKVSEVSNG